MRTIPLSVLALAIAGCSANSSTAFDPGSGAGGAGGAQDGGGDGANAEAGDGGGKAGSGGGGGAPSDGSFLEVGNGDGALDPDAACAVAVEPAQTEVLPVDIIWMVDNSSSMAPAVAAVQAGLNAFASSIAAKNLDYKVIMLSLRSATSPVVVGGNNRYPVCIPEPLAGDASCGNGARFFQSSMDILSTQPLEQFLGTLGQTTGYLPGDARGGDPWAQELRANATKTIVVLTDDNSRLTADQFEHFAGGKNPFNSTMLPPGILDPSWSGLFDGFLFSAIYGWGSDTDPSVKCTYTGGGSPPASGATYTDLVTQTGGVRAKICDDPTAWDTFFDQVATSVVQAAKMSCELAIPPPSKGTLDPGKVNVQLDDGAMPETIFKVTDASACGAAGGWYYDDPVAPTKVILCPTSCDLAQTKVGPSKNGKIQVLFGCDTLVK